MDYKFRATELELLSAPAKQFTRRLVRKYDKTDFFKNLQPSEVAFRATWKGRRYVNTDKENVYEEEIQGYGRMLWTEFFTLYDQKQTIMQKPTIILLCSDSIVRCPSVNLSWNV